MGRKKTAQELVDFINSIPDSKMLGFTHGEHELFKDVNFRLDMQGLTSGRPQYYNLHVQINKGTTITSLKRETGKSVAKALVPMDGSWSAQKIRGKLIADKLL
ncbi:hypothetical protein DTO013E5_8051 [Penicillium roqueforti]|uniref:Genomic scaffold, ProqFM164S04 n=1 Tax=Penicillium roqueforti (strain FM164) TaxID=1365484 RepID=W6QMR5_PENRF|nr:hypothetical protein DTO012A1_4102 [Penicillium roqueforti]CDM35464.1 unnamed protein product [Penicillium roqueforti FM164]KAI2744222.1 hypothetical protein DTO013F2_7913 [Penicillium roqueforti]KAI2774110.1 hypothetical protein DTO012A8_1419 [Penicillium roqueforti]KAI3074457.1 hypothetical protein CBS147339_5834 [Penicillium roqueforti]